LGGGVTQIFMMVGLFMPLRDAGVPADTAWRVSMVVPASLLIMCAVCIKLLCWDTPTKRRLSPEDLGKPKSSSFWDYIVVLQDPLVVLMIFQYSASFGCELTMNNQLATHFRTYFQMEASSAALMAGCFGMMNLWARSLGGIISDLLFARMGMRGRIWAQFLGLVFQSIFLFIFGCVPNSQPWYVALVALIPLSVFTQLSSGTAYSMVPFMSKTHLAHISALVGAGGNLGAVIAGFGFYNPINDDLLPFKVHAAYVMFWALLSPFYYWPEYGGMFSGPKAKELSPASPAKAFTVGYSTTGSAQLDTQRCLSKMAVPEEKDDGDAESHSSVVSL
jgi:NNP family nitrate/nitrite transporter-like MFS transporter